MGDRASLSLERVAATGCQLNRNSAIEPELDSTPTSVRRGRYPAEDRFASNRCTGRAVSEDCWGDVRLPSASLSWIRPDRASKEVERVTGIEPALAFWAKSTEWPLPRIGRGVLERPLVADSTRTRVSAIPWPRATTSILFSIAVVVRGKTTHNRSSCATQQTISSCVHVLRQLPRVSFTVTAEPPPGQFATTRVCAD